VNLDIAASLVGLSRKTLDDYYKYIRKAEQFHFDFKGRADEKIGVLRNFVRDRQKRLNKHDLDEPSDELSPKIEDAQIQNNSRNNSNDENVHTILSPGGGNHHHSMVNSERIVSSRNSLPSNLSPPPPYAHEIHSWKDLT